MILFLSCPAVVDEDGDVDEMIEARGTEKSRMNVLTSILFCFLLLFKIDETVCFI